MAVMVLAAFLDSGGLNAGTPLAMASTPVKATDPLAKALRRRKTVKGSGLGGWKTVCWCSGVTSPASTRTRPVPIMSRARPMNR